MVKGMGGLSDGQNCRFSLKQHQRYAPEVARLVKASSVIQSVTFTCLSTSVVIDSQKKYI